MKTKIENQKINKKNEGEIRRKNGGIIKQDAPYTIGIGGRCGCGSGPCSIQHHIRIIPI